MARGGATRFFADSLGKIAASGPNNPRIAAWLRSAGRRRELVVFDRPGWDNRPVGAD